MAAAGGAGRGGFASERCRGRTRVYKGKACRSSFSRLLSMCVRAASGVAWGALPLAGPRPPPWAWRWRPAHARARRGATHTSLTHARPASASLSIYVADRGHFYRAACHATAAIAKANRRGASAKSSRLLTTVTDRLAPAMTRKDDVARWSTNVAKAASAQCGWSLVSWQHYSSRF
jgi:hypothetical protein